MTELSPALARVVARSVEHGPGDARRYGVLTQGSYDTRRPSAPVPALRRLIELDLVAEVRVSDAVLRGGIDYAGPLVKREWWARVRPSSVRLNARGIEIAERIFGEEARD